MDKYTTLAMWVFMIYGTIILYEIRNLMIRCYRVLKNFEGRGNT